MTYPRLSTWLGMLIFFTNSNLSGRVSRLISSFHCNRWFWLVLGARSLGQYPVNVVAPWGSIPGPTPFVLYMNDFLDDICNIAFCTDDNSLNYKCGQGSNLWQQLELASYFKSDLPDTVDFGRKLLVAIIAGKHQLVSFHWSSKSCANCKNGKICFWWNIVF